MSFRAISGVLKIGDKNETNTRSKGSDPYRKISDNDNTAPKPSEIESITEFFDKLNIDNFSGTVTKSNRK